MLALLAISPASLPAQGPSIEAPVTRDPVLRAPVPKSPYGPIAARAIPGRVIVKLTSDAAAHGVTAMMVAGRTRELGAIRSAPLVNPALIARDRALERVNGSHRSSAGIARIAVVEYAALTAPQDAAAALSALPEVEYAEPMFPRHLLYATNDPAASQLWYLDVIGARQAWDDVRADSTIVIAVVDAGIDPGHEDLAASLWRNAGEMGTDGSGADRRTNGIDDDANGYVDDWQGYDFAGADGRTPDNDPDPARESHGTEMAGIAGAVGDNARGTVGVAYGARLMSLKITNEPQSSLDEPELFNTHEAILYAAKMGADVINCSWGDLGRMRSEQEVIDAATNDYGAVVVASAGNAYNDDLFYPASYDGVLSVAAVTNSDTKAAFSNFNYRIDLSAPGTFIYAPGLGNTYAYGQGTSHAAAVVSGAAALVRRKFPLLSPPQVIELLRATSDDNSAALGEYAGKLGAGRVSVLNAITDGATMVSARVAGTTVIDAGGDGVLDPGEAASLRLDIRNYLAAAPDVVVSVAAVSPSVPVESGEIDLGAMAAGADATTPIGSVRFTVPTGAAPNSTMIFKITVRTAMRTNDCYVTLRVAPTFMTTDLNDISATFNSRGNIGYDGTNHDLGDGFHASGGKDLIYHAGLMIGTDATHLSDVVRVGSMSSGAADGLRLINPYRVTRAADGSVEIGRARFGDAHRDASQRVGVDVSMETYEYADAADRDYVLVVYSIRNAGATRLENLHAGLYIDWDVAMLGERDVASLDEPSRLGYVSNTNVPTVVAGAALVSDGALDYNAVDNNAIGISSSFTSEQKWQLLGNGIGERTTPPTDVGMVIGSGPFSLEPGESRNVAYMLGARESLDSLRASAERARERYRVVAGIGPQSPILATSLRAVALPNPASDAARLDVSLARTASVRVRLLDVTGRTVVDAFAGTLDAGAHDIPLSITSLPSGVYLYEVIAGAERARGQIVKVGH
jgi:subtilisin family serine protease